jgi:hypothetical protein
MHLTDRLTIDGTKRTADGYLAINARAARAGNVQTYLGAEVGRPDLSQVRVYRPDGEVFSKDTMASFAHRPVTMGHPSTPVSATNWNQFAKGWSDGEIARDGEFIRINMLLADADAIRAVESGVREISMGYDCDLIWGAGTSPSGEVYDARQSRIRGNHVAIVERARGGSELRIGDSAMNANDGLTAGMTVDQAAALPRYQKLGPQGRQYAARDLAMLQAGNTDRSAHDGMVQRLGDAWQGDRQQIALPNDIVAGLSAKDRSVVLPALARMRDQSGPALRHAISDARSIAAQLLGQTSGRMISGSEISHAQRAAQHMLALCDAASEV